MGLDTVVVRQSHVIDDLSRELAAYKRMTSDLRWLLRTGLDACDGGNQPITREYLDRALTALGKVTASSDSEGPVVHLHTPTSGPVCGAPRIGTAMTAYRSAITCSACKATLHHPPVPPAVTPNRKA